MNGALAALTAAPVDPALGHARLPLARLLDPHGWLDEHDLPGAGAGAAEIRALLSRGLLTDALARCHGAPVRVRRTRHVEVWAAGHPGLRRDVVIHAGARVCALASTLMPGPVLEAHPWLRELGDRALGESLAERGAVNRGRYRFRLLPAEESPWPAGDDGARVWARRYEFELAAGALVVVESFAPGVLRDIGAL